MSEPNFTIVSRAGQNPRSGDKTPTLLFELGLKEKIPTPRFWQREKWELEYFFQEAHKVFLRRRIELHPDRLRTRDADEQALRLSKLWGLIKHRFDYHLQTPDYWKRKKEREARSRLTRENTTQYRSALRAYTYKPKWDTNPRPCEQCGVKYQPTKWDQRFCCPAHKQKFYIQARKQLTETQGSDILSHAQTQAV